MNELVRPAWMPVLSALIRDNSECWALVSSLRSDIFPQPHATLFSLLRQAYLRTGHSPTVSQFRRLLLISGFPPEKTKRLANCYKECAVQAPQGWDVEALIADYHERIYISALEKAVKCLSEPVILQGSKESIGGVSGAQTIMSLAEREMDVSGSDVEDDVKGLYIRQEESGGPPLIRFSLFEGLFDLFRKELWLLSAFSGEGKTTLMFNLVVDAYLQGEKVMIISLETETYKLRWKLAVVLAAKKGTPISLFDVAYFKLNPQDKQIFYDSLSEVNNIKIKPCSGTGLYEILGVLRSEKKSTLVFLDNINLASARSRQFFDKISEALKGIVRYVHSSVNLTMIVLAQSSRTGHKEAVESGRYSLTALADTNEAERSSDGVFWILQTGYLKSILGYSKNRMLPSDIMKTSSLSLDPNSLVFSVDGTGGSGQAATMRNIDLEE